MDTDTFLSILRKQGLHASITIPAELREQTDCTQMRAESGFIEAKPLSYLVFVHRVDLCQQGLQVHDASIVKYSRSKYAPANAEHLKIATPQHYRDYAGSGSGVRDENGAVYLESLRSYFEKWNPAALARPGPWRGIATVNSRSLTWETVPSGSVTYCVDGQWMFCASLSSERQMTIDSHGQSS